VEKVVVIRCCLDKHTQAALAYKNNSGVQPRILGIWTGSHRRARVSDTHTIFLDVLSHYDCLTSGRYIPCLISISPS
jgi:hypothetical protein